MVFLLRYIIRADIVWVSRGNEPRGDDRRETMASYYIEGKAQGAVMGIYQGADPAEALASMHRDAGYDVRAEGGSMIFGDDETRELCGDLDAWHVAPVVHGWDAIELARETGCELHHYTTPIEEARDGISIDEAEEIAAADPGLIWAVA
jgi:hypothetical protein